MATYQTKEWLKLRDLANRRMHINKEIDNLVAVLASPGLDGYAQYTWRQIGLALGVSPQAAQQKYRHLSWSFPPDGDEQSKSS